MVHVSSQSYSDGVGHGLGEHVGAQDVHVLEPASETALVSAPRDARLANTDAKAAVMVKASSWIAEG